ncbi:SDR family NAD(P)-dependent oxidoreductase [Archangium sp.]|uniref:SDR family NAD(P)-dependent oxidoreductase n=1 Tax=Archangium sp. TaxID=1872627 RepID=UPI002ED856F5
MSFENRVVVVIGASGVVGSGVVRKYLDAGATVVGVSRSASKLEQLTQQMKIQSSEPFISVVGDFKDEASAREAKKAVATALQGKPIDHVVSVQGFVSYAKAPTSTPPEELKAALDDGLFNNLLAAKAFLPELKEREGSSFTLVSGGLAHIPPPNISLWLGTVKNAALNALTLALAAETANDKVRLNTLCIHFAVAPLGGDKNQFGLTAEGDTLRLAPAFLGVARGTQKGQLLCLNSFADAEKLSVR